MSEPLDFKKRARRLVLRGLAIPVYRDLVQSTDERLLREFERLSPGDLRKINESHERLRRHFDEHPSKP